MSKIRGLLIFLVALTIGEIPNFAPWYCNIFMNSGSFSVHRFDEFYTSTSGNIIRYTLPMETLVNSGKDSELSVSLGVVRPLASINCGPNSAALEPIPTLQAIDQPNTPIKIDLQKFAACRHVMAVDIQTNGIIGVQQSGSVIIGSKETVKASVDLVTFFSDRFRLILTFTVFLILFLRTRDKILGITVQENSDFAPNLFLWSLFLSLSSGLLLTVLPFPLSPEFVLKMLYGSSAACHLSPVVSYLVGKKKFQKTFLPIMVLLLLPIVLLPSGGYIYSVIGGALTSAAISLACFERKPFGILNLYFITYLSSLLKVGLAPSAFSFLLPHWHFAPIFIGIFLLSQVFEENRKNAMVFKALKFLQLELKSKTRDFDVQNALKEMCGSLKCTKATMLRINHDNSCTISTIDTSHGKTEFEIKKLQTFPPAFSHAITTRKSLYHIEEESDFAGRLRDKAELQKLGFPHFSIIPITGSRGELGAIACTGYTIDVSDRHSTVSFESSFQIFSGYFGKILEAAANAEKLGASKDIIEAVSKLDDINSIYDRQVLDDSLKTFADVLGCKGFLGIVDEVSGYVRIQSTFNLTENESKAANAISMRADDSNEHGPVPLAIKTGQPAFVNEVALVRGLLSEASGTFFSETKAAAIAVIPFEYKAATNEKNIKAFLYLSSESSYTFDEFCQDATIHYTDSLKSRLNNIALAQSHDAASNRLRISAKSLAQFLPEHLVEDYLAGKEVQELDHGFLMMLDLKGSTNLARVLSSNVFHNEVRSFKETIEPILISQKWMLRQFVWDGFEFTNSASEFGAEKVSVVFCRDLIEPLFLHWKNKLIGKYGEIEEIRSLSFRICFTFGDTSRGIVVEGQTQKWSFTGDAIAVVSKVEQEAKQLAGKIFCDSTMLNRTDELWIKIHSSTQGLSVFGLQEEQSGHEDRAA